jgi:hypothetical protein
MERDENQHDLVDLGDARDLTRGLAPSGDDDNNGTLKKGSGISDMD